MRAIGWIVIAVCAFSTCSVQAKLHDSSELSANLGRARFDAAIPLLEDCKVQRSGAEAASCALLLAGIYRNQGNAAEWAKVMLWLKEGGIDGALDADALRDFRSKYYADVDFRRMSALPASAITYPPGRFSVPVVAHDEGKQAGGSLNKLYWIEIESDGIRARALVDTGAPHAISMSLYNATRLGISEVLGRARTSARQLEAVHPTYQNEYRLAKRVSIGDLTLSNVMVEVDPNATDDTIILGTGVLTRFRTVTFSKSRLAFNADERPAKSRSAAFRFLSTFDLGSSKFLIETRLKGVAYPTMIDTGLSSTLAIANPLAATLARDDDPEFTPGDENGVMPAFKVSHQSVSFDGIALTDAPTLLFWKSPPSSDFSIIIGGELKEALDMQFDFDAGRIYFWPSAGALDQGID